MNRSKIVLKLDHRSEDVPDNMGLNYRLHDTHMSRTNEGRHFFILLSAAELDTGRRTSRSELTKQQFSAALILDVSQSVWPIVYRLALRAIGIFA